MRNLFLFIIFLFISNVVIAQDKLLGILPLKNGKVTYSDEIQLQGVSKDEIYTRTKHWFINTYSSGKDVIQLDDKENGEIIGKACFKEKWPLSFYTSMSVNVWKTIKIQIQNNHVRFEISDFRLKNYYLLSQNQSITDVGIPLEEWNKRHNSRNMKFYPKINEQVNNIIKSFENAIELKQNDN
jgi:hypothetical protein